MLSKILVSVLAFVIILLLIKIILLVSKKRQSSTDYLIKAIKLGICTQIFYTIFFCSTNKAVAGIFNNAYFILTDWLAFYMLKFSLEYTVPGKKFRIIDIIFKVLCILDSLYVFGNISLHFIFNKIPLYYSYNISAGLFGDGIEYWSLDVYPIHFIHLGWCYVMVLWTFGQLLWATVKAPGFYKSRYFAILGMYIVVIAVNYISYTMNTPIDVSVYLYGSLASFICYYSTYMAPKNLLNSSLREVNDSFSDGIIYFDSQGKCCYSNQKAKEYMLENPDFHEQKIETYVLNRLIEQQETSDSRKGKIDKATWEDTIKVSGQELHFIIDFQRFSFAGRIVGSYIKVRDVTEERNEYDKERYSSTHDELTGIYNREYFFECADRLIQSDPYTERVMICSNIKDFKLVNDIFGQETGDNVLKLEARLLSELCHSDSIFGRIGDDKFALLMNKAYFNQKVFEDCIDKMKKLAQSSSYKLHIQMGVCEVHGIYDSAQFLYDKAHLAIKSIQDSYTTYCVNYDSNLMDKLLAEKNILGEFDSALANGDLKVYLQPVVDENRKLLGAEALSRWINPVRGIISPERYVDVLERTGLIHHLDTFMWEESAKILKEWEKNGYKDLSISVNISTRDYYYVDIFKILTGIVEKYGVNPHKFRLEFNETALTSDYDKAVELFSRLRKYGFPVGIDDFGRGYSSLNLLKDVEMDYLKLDTGFIAENENLERSRKILKFMVQMAGTLGISIVSERVEDDAQFKILEELGCHVFQGYWYGEPVFIENFGDVYLKKDRN